jgi:hypothetical protein
VIAFISGAITLEPDSPADLAHQLLDLPFTDGVGSAVVSVIGHEIIVIT